MCRVCDIIHEGHAGATPSPDDVIRFNAELYTLGPDRLNEIWAKQSFGGNLWWLSAPLMLLVSAEIVRRNSLSAPYIDF
jgi:hypothetical protein